MPPWIEASYFDTPQFTKTGLSSAVSALNTPNPQAVLLVLINSTQSAGGTPIVWPASTVSTNNGFILNTNFTNLIIDVATWGPLCTMQWFGTVWAGASATVATITLALAKWPTGGGSGKAQPSISSVQQAINSLSAYMKQLANNQRAMQQMLARMAQGDKP